MNKSELIPSSDKKHNIVLFIDYVRNTMKLIIMGEIIKGDSAEGDKIKTDITNVGLHCRYQYDEQTELGYVQHKFQYHGQENPKKIYTKLIHYWSE